MRAWGLDLRVRASDYARYAAVLLVLVGLIGLLLVQSTELVDTPSWDGDVIAIGWVALLTAYFVWASHLLTHGLIGARAFLPGALLTSLGLVLLMLLSSFVMATWVDFYAKDYGGLGVIMALFFSARAQLDDHRRRREPVAGARRAARPAARLGDPPA